MPFVVLIIEDDPEAVKILNQLLKGEGYEIESAASVVEAKSAIKRLEVDLVLLDVNLEEFTAGKNSDFVKLVGDSLIGEEGYEIAAWLRDNYPHVRIIFLTSAKGVSDRVRGLDLGGDDYVTKPFVPAELKARIRSTLRRSEKKLSDVEVFCNWKFDLTLSQISHLLRPEMKPINLNTAESNILRELLNARGAIVSREKLSKRAFGRPLLLHDRAVDTSISKLRSKLDDGNGPNFQIIETVHGSGYRITRR